MSGDKMGFNATWAMAVGGMIGGGIFSVLGVVVSVSGAWFPVSFLIGGLIALATAWSYGLLAVSYGEGGGAFTFLRHERMPDAAGALSWILILGYALTMSVYAYTFSAYLSNAIGLGDLSAEAAAVGIVGLLVVVNLVGVTQAAEVEIVSVWGKVAILLALGIVGLAGWDTSAMSGGAEGTPGLAGALVGASAVFMAYEGFQLLTYDYEDLSKPRSTLPKALLTSVASVIVIYIIVSTGAVMLTGAATIVKHKEVALAIAGEEAAGSFGRWAVTLAAVLSTASAINATLFATARLTQRVSEAGELPRALQAENGRGIPYIAVILLGVVGAGLAVIGGLSHLVEAASLTFLLTFAAVNAIAFREATGRRWIPISGAAGAVTASIVLAVRIAAENPVSLIALGALMVGAVVLRPLIADRK